MSCPLTNAIIGLVGVLVGALAGHWLTVYHHNGETRRAFSGFLKKWLAELNAVSGARSHGVGGIGSDPARDAFYDKIPVFEERVALVSNLYKGREWDRLCNAVRAMNHEQGKPKARAEDMRKAVSELIEATRT
jgi:hypothetical protein